MTAGKVTPMYVVPDYCEHCREDFLPTDARVELYADDPNAKDIRRLGLESITVHAEPCATDLTNNGWSVA